MSALASTTGARGGPLVLLVLVLSAWTGARTVWWESPFAPVSEAFGIPVAVAPRPPAATLALATGDAAPKLLSAAATVSSDASMAAAARRLWATVALTPSRLHRRIDPQFAAAHLLLWQASQREPLLRVASAHGFSSQAFAASDPPPFLPRPQPDARVAAQRWTLDGWAFWRQGSGSAPVSEGRVPIYGASQVGAVLQYRLGAQGRHDPRVYARAYRALVQRGESELALGASVRPVPQIPVRVAGEVRYTDAASANAVRPSAYAVTELPPIRLPYGAQLEAYGQAGWVGGASATAFADGQASVTREVQAVGRATDHALRLSIGAGAWGGAQVNAQRIDLGPTMRLDLTVGDVPARLSLDWRERIGGDARPDSGLAATLSTRF